MPVVYLSHGAPPLADDPIWPGELAGRPACRGRTRSWSSATWENAPVSVSATRTVPLLIRLRSRGNRVVPGNACVVYTRGRPGRLGSESSRVSHCVRQAVEAQ